MSKRKSSSVSAAGLNAEAEAPRVRCVWSSQTSDEMIRYHDEEWGVPTRDDKKLFEFLVLEGAQAGLSWSTILKKRENYRRAFAAWDVAQVAAFDEARVQALLQDEGIVRNKLKVRSAIAAAKAILEIQKEHGSLSAYLWSFLPNRQPLVRHVETKATAQETWPTTSPESDAMSKALKKKGFSFVGSTILYAFMQAVGMINDHTTSCFRYKQLITVQEDAALPVLSPSEGVAVEPPKKKSRKK